MELFAYGEDALTLWAMKNRFSDILKQLGDTSKGSGCKVLYRPSFGRRGGLHSSQFGEFDFIILSENKVYLGESKWDGSSELTNGIIELREEQLLRHKIFNCYLECWLKNKCSCWDEFREKLKSYFEKEGIPKPAAPTNSILASNLQTILDIIKKHFHTFPEIKNVLLYMHKTKTDLPNDINGNFKLLLVDYSDATVDNLIKMEI
ncbi:MAG: hypothetical protein KAW45_03570 [Thermoplasmatales archaeon]|nr:hypothetical protein [Thermoplasmatales archaeon]